MDSVLEILENYMPVNAIGNIDDIIEACSAISEEKALDLISDFENAFQATSLSDDKFAYLADARLSGLPVYCSASGCRKNYLLDLTAFGALYADRVFITNPFTYAKSQLRIINNTQEYKFIDNLSLAIEYAFRARPLLERGLVQFSSYEAGGYCMECAAKAMGLGANSSSFTDKIRTHCYETSVAQYVHAYGNKTIRIDYDESHGEHSLYHDPDDIESYFEEGKVLSKEEAFELRIFDSHAVMSAHDFFVKNKEANRLNVSNVLSSSQETSLISTITGSQKNALFNADYPTLYNHNIKNLLNLRESEWKHLEKYRNLVDELKKEHQDDWTEILSKLKFEEEQLSRLIAKQKYESKTKLFDSAVVGTFGLGGALVTTGLPGFISELATIIGGGHLAKEGIPALRQTLSESTEVRSSAAYYPWKIKKILN